MYLVPGIYCLHVGIISCCEIEVFVETQLCKMRAIMRSRVLHVCYMLHGLMKHVHMFVYCIHVGGGSAVGGGYTRGSTAVEQDALIPGYLVCMMHELKKKH